ncbi:cysteine dioxygenase [Caballeronia mineralivorans]|jgi:predicted metal-dependent enzyme (double-stranded beta helix superfamily)|uniref:cysteine dioxygenase family protein n=1 Tax=Caballeronia mineralivorans TaxID=2010198 RepID=UPI0023F03C5B|nr:cysteine dioxygenase [Caballeronia mineralivorans]MDB5780213.1 Cysteine dioxygenase [Caballeronia mineralivorans]MEA3095821.1 3-mercaptopropionate dioxygenase [Caballeronia mineralivorans]
MSHEKLRGFISEIAQLVDDHLPEAQLLEQGAVSLSKLIAEDNWLPDSYAQPSADRYQQFLLYADARQRFSVVSFVWAPGQQTPVHDHTVWGLVGVLRGAEVARSYARDEQGTLITVGEDTLLERGAVAAVSPSIGDIHRVSNAFDDRVSISIHVYGANIGGVSRHVYPADGPPKPFVSGYTNDTLPNLWNLSKERLNS